MIDNVCFKQLFVQYFMKWHRYVLWHSSMHFILYHFTPSTPSRRTVSCGEGMPLVRWKQEHRRRDVSWILKWRSEWRPLRSLIQVYLITFSRPILPIFFTAFFRQAFSTRDLFRITRHISRCRVLHTCLLQYATFQLDLFACFYSDILSYASKLKLWNISTELSTGLL